MTRLTAVLLLLLSATGARAEVLNPFLVDVQAGSTGFTSAISAPNFNASGIGAGDANAYMTGTYWYDDFLVQSTYASAVVAGTGAAVLGFPTPGGVTTLPTGWTAASVAPHYGVLTVSVSALNDAAGYFVGPGGALPIFTISPNMIWSYEFSTPNVLSTASDRYEFYVGAGQTFSSGIPNQGYYLGYSDNVNSGNWVLYEAYGAAEGNKVVIQNSNVAVTALTWNNLQIRRTGSVVSAVLNGNTIAQGTPAFPTVANPLPAGLAVFALKRTAFASGQISAFLDRASFYTTSARTLP